MAVIHQEVSNLSDQVLTFAPQKKQRIDQAQQREVVRLLRFLRDDIKRKETSIKLPNTWTLRCIVQSCDIHIQYSSKHWLRDINRFLRAINMQSIQEKRGRTQFFQMDGVTRLFPTDERFTFEDFIDFIKETTSILCELEEKLS